MNVRVMDIGGSGVAKSPLQSILARPHAPQVCLQAGPDQVEKAAGKLTPTRRQL